MKPLLWIGERLNITGSATFASAFRRRDWGTVRRLAAEQVRQGAIALDICLSGCGENEPAAVMELLSECRLDVPVLLDSMNPDVFRMVLPQYSRVLALNSTNLMRGAAPFQATCELASQYGVPLVFGCLDEQGVAVRALDKLRIIDRMMQLAQGILPASALIVDVLALPLRTTPEGARETATAIAMVKRAYPGMRTLAAISNVSYSLRMEHRAEIEAEFLESCMKAGLDYAILNTARISALSTRYSGVR